MTEQNFDTLLHRRDTTRNMSRFYHVVVERDLFGAFLAVRRWGRIGTLGRSRQTACPSLPDALEIAEFHARRKRRRGYVE